MSGAGLVGFARRHWALLVVVTVAIGVRWMFLAGDVGSDDVRYINSAVALAHGHPPERLDHVLGVDRRGTDGVVIPEILGPGS